MFVVTQQAKDAVAHAQAAKGHRYREVENADGSTRLVPARLGTAPLLASTAEDHDEDDSGTESASKGMRSVGPATAQVTHGAGPVIEALAGHGQDSPSRLNSGQHQAVMPSALANLRTTEPTAYAGPTFTSGTATAQQQNHRAPTGTFPQAHAPGQVPFHTAPIHPGGHR
jgi:hypothetical protein